MLQNFLHKLDKRSNILCFIWPMLQCTLHFKTNGKFMPSILAQCFWLKFAKYKMSDLVCGCLYYVRNKVPVHFQWWYDHLNQSAGGKLKDLFPHTGVNDPTLLQCQGKYVTNVTVIWIVMPHSFVVEPATCIFRVEPQILCHCTLKFKSSCKVSIFFTL
jgi:hypothetical protein